MNTNATPNASPLPAEIFKAYDIRGIVGTTLTTDIVRRIGHGLGSLAVDRGQRAIAVGSQNVDLEVANPLFGADHLQFVDA